MGKIEKRVGMTRGEQKGGTFLKRTIFLFVFFSVMGTSLFSQTGEGVTVWGWSKDGKVAVTEELDTGNTGWRVTRAFIFNTVNDTVLWENRSATENLYDDDAYNRAYSAFIDNFNRIIRQPQYAIEIEQGYIFRKNLISASFNNNNNSFYINVDVFPLNRVIHNSAVFYDNLESYSVYVTSGTGKRKTILTEKRKNEPIFGDEISVYGYNLSPDNERVLIVIKTKYSFHDGGFRYLFTGCNLKVGF
jgi:hypothetical protein